MLTTDRSPELHNCLRSRVLIVDVQERLVAALPRGAELVANVRWLAEAAKLCGVPVLITEQYPQGLGATVASLQEFAAERPSKKRFSGVQALALPSAIDDPQGRDQVILAGMETHVCVLQTAFDLLALGYRVTIAVDAVCSRRVMDHQIAIQRLRDSGATVATIEAIAFEWLETAEGEEFRAFSALVKSRPVS